MLALEDQEHLLPWIISWSRPIVKIESIFIFICSAGVGRSGTFIALDYLMDQADSEDRVNIYF